MDNKFCIYDHEQHRILREIEQKDGSVLVEIETTTVFPRKYFVPKELIEEYTKNYTVTFSNQETNLLLMTVCRYMNDVPMKSQIFKTLESIRDKIEEKMNERN